MLKALTRGGVALLTIAAATLLVATPANATNQGTVPGDSASGCAIEWSAASVMNPTLQDDDPEFPGLMTNIDGTPIPHYSNGGYIQEVHPAYGGAGLLEINHWYSGVGPGPHTTTQPTQVNWRLPIATDAAMTGATIEIQLPSLGSGFTFSSGQNIAGWGGEYANYTWNGPGATAVPSADGLTWTVDLGDLPAASGVVVMLSGTVPAGVDLGQHQVASATLRAAAVPGSSDECPTPGEPTSGDGSQGCTIDWQTDASLLITDGDRSTPDVTRGQVVSPELGDPGKLGIDGWSTPPTATASAGLHGRFVLASDGAIESATWVLQLDQGMAEPTFEVSTPAPTWRVDEGYRTPVTIDAGVWDAAAGTMTYTLSMPADSSVMVSYSATAAEGTYVSGTTYRTSSTLQGTLPASACDAPDVPTPSDPAPSDPAPSDPAPTGSAPADPTPTTVDTASGTLPATGADGTIVGGTAAALLLLAAGGLLLARRHRTRA